MSAFLLERKLEMKQTALRMLHVTISAAIKVTTTLKREGDGV